MTAPADTPAMNPTPPASSPSTPAGLAASEMKPKTSAAQARP